MPKEHHYPTYATTYSDEYGYNTRQKQQQQSWGFTNRYDNQPNSIEHRDLTYVPPVTRRGHHGYRVMMPSDASEVNNIDPNSAAARVLWPPLTEEFKQTLREKTEPAPPQPPRSRTNGRSQRLLGTLDRPLVQRQRFTTSSSGAAPTPYNTQAELPAAAVGEPTFNGYASAPLPSIYDQPPVVTTGHIYGRELAGTRLGTRLMPSMAATTGLGSVGSNSGYVAPLPSGYSTRGIDTRSLATSGQLQADIAPSWATTPQPSASAGSRDIPFLAPSSWAHRPASMATSYGYATTRGSGAGNATISRSLDNTSAVPYVSRLANARANVSANASLQRTGAASMAITNRDLTITPVHVSSAIGYATTLHAPPPYDLTSAERTAHF